MATVDGVPSAKDCCRECTARNVAAGRRECTVFNFCGQAGGCNYTHQQDESKSVVLQQGQCEYTCTSGNNGALQLLLCALCRPPGLVAEAHAVAAGMPAAARSSADSRTR